MSKHGTSRARNVYARALGIFWITITSVWPAWAGSGAWSQTQAKPLPTLVHASQIRRLSPEQAALGYPLRVRGVITMDAPPPDFFIQDTTAGIYVEGSVSPNYPHLLGQLVEVERATGPGRLASVIREQKLRGPGKGGLPRAALAPFS